MILRRPEVIELLDKKYGRGGWQKQYKDHYRGQTTMLKLLSHIVKSDFGIYDDCEVLNDGRGLNKFIHKL
jgi:hypothetical protein